MKIYLIRHAESTGNVEQIFGGDTPLSQEGINQCVDARVKYKNIQFDRVYASKLIRTKETAKLLFGVPAHRELGEFNELWYGSIEGQKSDDMFFREYNDNYVAFLRKYKGDDPYERAVCALKCMYNIVEHASLFPEKFSNGNIAIVTSAMLMRCIILTLKYGYTWKSTKEVPFLNHMDALVLNFDETNSLTDIRLMSTYKDRIILSEIIKEITLAGGLHKKKKIEHIHEKCRPFIDIINKHYQYSWTLRSQSIIDRMEKGDIEAAYDFVWKYLNNENEYYRYMLEKNRKEAGNKWLKASGF